MAIPLGKLVNINKDVSKFLKSLGGAGEDINGGPLNHIFLKHLDQQKVLF